MEVVPLWDQWWYPRHVYIKILRLHNHDLGGKRESVQIEWRTLTWYLSNFSILSRPWTCPLASVSLDQFPQTLPESYFTQKWKKGQQPSEISLVFLIRFLSFCFYVWLFCLHTYMYTMFVLGAHRGQKRPSDSLEWQLQMIIKHHMEAENGMWVFWEQQVLSTLNLTLQPVSFNFY